MSWTVKLPEQLRLELCKLIGAGGESPEQFVVRALEKEMRTRRQQDAHLFRPYRHVQGEPGEEGLASEAEQECEESSVN